MATISLCMIVKNEEDVLARCLDSVGSAVDEIVIVDTGSGDRTGEIARRYTPRVYDFAWCGDFSAARNAAYARAAMDYQMWLDADDVLPEESRQALADLKETLDPAVDMVTMPYHLDFDETGAPTVTSVRERLTRREGGYRWQDPVHECIPLEGNILHTEIAVHHRKPGGRDQLSTRNLQIYEALEAAGELHTPRRQYYFARELWEHGYPARATRYFRLFLEGGGGWLEDNVAACHALASCLRELGDEEGALSALLRSFRYDSPRAEILCELGYHCQRQGEWERALDWFMLALSLPQRPCHGFLLRDSHGYVPHIEACVCLYRLGRVEEAREHNEHAALLRPGAPAVLHNRSFFEALDRGGA